MGKNRKLAKLGESDTFANAAVGAVVGGVIAGPIGAVAGAAIGVMVEKGPTKGKLPAKVTPLLKPVKQVRRRLPPDRKQLGAARGTEAAPPRSGLRPNRRRKDS